MKSRHYIRIDIITLIIFLLIFLVNESTILFGTTDNMFLVRTGQFSVIFFMVYFLVKQRMHNNMTAVAMLLSIVVLVTMVAHFDFQLNYILTLACIWCGYLFVCRIDFPTFTEKYNRILYVLSLISLIASLLIFIAPSIVRRFPRVINLSGDGFYNMIMCMVPSNFDTYRYRNYGIFREPGVYQFILSLGVLFEIYDNRGINRRRTIVYILALLSTLSTTAYISVIFLLAIYLSKKNTIKTRNKIMVIIACVILFYLLLNYTTIFDADTLEYSVVRKLKGITGFFGDGRGLNSSLAVRFGSIIVHIYLFFHNIFWGCGMRELYSSLPAVSSKLFGYMLRYPSETFFMQFAKFGIVMGLIWTLGYASLSHMIGERRTDRVLVFLLLIIQLMAENYSGYILVYILFWYGIKSRLMETRMEFNLPGQ